MLSLKSTVLRFHRNRVHDILNRGIHRKNTYYEALGITPHATQVDIKKAFYNLSMQHHPDKPTGNEVKFREINAAYEVLGNLKLRRLYDRGLVPTGASNVRDVDDIVEKEETQFSEKYTHPDGKFRQRPPQGRTSTYDYDEWSRAHYDDLYTRRSPHNVRKAAEQYRQRVREAQRRAEALLFVVGFMMISMILFGRPVLENHDRPRIRRSD